SPGHLTETWTRTRTKTGQRLFDGQQAARLHQANQADLQVKPRLQRVLQILEEIERELEVARQLAAEMLQVLSVALQLVDHFQHAPRIARGERERDLLERFERKRAE